MKRKAGFAPGFFCLAGRRRHHVMSQARVFLRTTPAVQDIPSFESTEIGYAEHEMKRKPANTDRVDAFEIRIVPRRRLCGDVLPFFCLLQNQTVKLNNALSMN